MLDSNKIKEAYNEIKSKPGNMTPGIDGSTLDGFSNKHIDSIIKKLKSHEFKFKPSKRIYILKANGKKRPLGIPTPSDKIVQKVMKNILEKIWEPKFLNSSHGYRPNKSCYTALKEVWSWKNTTWMIEGDITGFFDNIDHGRLYELLKMEIKDKAFLDLIAKVMKAGYIETKSTKKELMVPDSGIAQGGLLSPLLSNIYLHELDKFMETICKEYSKNFESVRSKEYQLVGNVVRTAHRRYKKSYNLTKLNPKNTIETKLLKKALLIAIKQREKVSASSITGSKVNYVRYADDFLIGIIGSKSIAIEIKEKVQNFLKNHLKLDLNMDKTKITNVTKNFVRFLGYDISATTRKFYSTLRVKSKIGTRARVGWGNIHLYMPVTDVIKSLRDKGFVHKEKTQGIYKGQFIPLDEFSIVRIYKSVLMGILNYYILANNSYKFETIRYLLTFSAAHTIAAKRRSSLRKVFKKYGKHMRIKLNDKMSVDLAYNPIMARKLSAPTDPYQVIKFHTNSKFIGDEPCYNCGSTENVEAHHVKKLSNLNPKLSATDALMAKMKRKQIALCVKCHNLVHSGKYDGVRLS